MASAGTADRSYRPDIDGIRAIAILSVMLYHAGVPWLTGGFTGVDIFFVISGYLIGGHILSFPRSGQTASVFCASISGAPSGFFPPSISCWGSRFWLRCFCFRPARPSSLGGQVLPQPCRLLTSCSGIHSITLIPKAVITLS